MRGLGTDRRKRSFLCYSLFWIDIGRARRLRVLQVGRYHAGRAMASRSGRAVCGRRSKSSVTRTFRLIRPSGHVGLQILETEVGRMIGV